MKRFDPLIHRPPDLWIEVDIFSPSLPREPIYARLGVREIWRYDGSQLTVRILAPTGDYIDSISSKVFPDLPMDRFGYYVQRMVAGNETEVMEEFTGWIRSLPKS